MNWIIKHWYEPKKNAAGVIIDIGPLHSSHKPGDIVTDASGLRKYRVHSDGSLRRV